MLCRYCKCQKGIFIRHVKYNTCIQLDYVEMLKALSERPVIEIPVKFMYGALS